MNVCTRVCLCVNLLRRGGDLQQKEGHIKSSFESLMVWGGAAKCSLVIDQSFQNSDKFQRKDKYSSIKLFVLMEILLFHAYYTLKNLLFVQNLHLASYSIFISMFPSNLAYIFTILCKPTKCSYSPIDVVS